MYTLSKDSAGAAIVCDLHGIINRISHDQLGITDRCTKGTPFANMVDHGSSEKAANFVIAIAKNGAAFDWQLCVNIQGKIVLLHCMGFSDGTHLWIILAKTQSAATRVLEEMSLMQNEQNGRLRAALKTVSRVSDTVKNEAQFEELTRLYNDLGKTQRELAQRNAELETLRATLEAQHLELQAANARLDALATIDGLTGIANRRAFQASLEAECLRANRYQTPLALLMLDVDHFKSINDTFGHQAGDEVLIAMGEMLAICSRTTDFVARYGGEEFAIILVNTEQTAATEVAERLRAQIETAHWPHRAITVSIGIASCGPGADTPALLISQADKALYFSKQHGRNRVTHVFDLVSNVELKLQT